MDIEAIKARIDAQIKQFRDDYNRTAEITYGDNARTLGAGARLPQKGVIYGNEARAAFDERAAKYQQTAAAELERAYKTLYAEQTAAPSADAVNTLTVLAMWRDVTADDLAALDAAIGQNYMVHHALAAYAERYKLPFEVAHKLDNAKAVLDSLRRVVNNMTMRSAESGNIPMSPASIAFEAWAADQF